MQREADKWAPHLRSTGELDVESLARMERLRQELLSTEAQTHLDRLMKLGAMRFLIGFMFLLT